MIILITMYTYECFTVFGYADGDKKRRILRNQNKLMFMIHFLAFAGMYLKIGEIKILIFYAVQVVLLLAIILLYTWIYPKDGINGDRESFRIIYLPPSEYKRPVEHSLCRPNNFAHKLPNKITEGILDCCSFDKLIVQWLDECIDSVKKNDRLREYLLQYRQYCQNL